MGAQRGNVTLITAFTMPLLMLLVIFSTGLSQSGSEADRMQASSDEAAITAASSYIAIQNDETVFEIIDWGLGFIDHMAQLLEEIGGVIGAIPFCEGIGAAIEAAASAVESAADGAKDAFDAIKDALNEVLDTAKSILSVVNATILAANNQDLGFILPGNPLPEGNPPTTYNIDTVNALVAHENQLVNTGGGNRDGLAGAIQVMALHSIWGNANDIPAPVDKNGNKLPCPGDPYQVSCSKTESRLGTVGNPDPGKDTFHIWNARTNGCKDDVNIAGDSYDWYWFWAVSNPIEYPFSKPLPAGDWKRPCNEMQWLQHLLQQPYWTEQARVDRFEQKLFDSTHPVFDDGGDPANVQKAKDELFKVSKQLGNIASGNGGDGDIGQVGDLLCNTTGTDCKTVLDSGNVQKPSFLALAASGGLDNWNAGACQVGPDKLSGYNSFKCTGFQKPDGYDQCKAAGCYDWWNHVVTTPLIGNAWSFDAATNTYTFHGTGDIEDFVEIPTNLPIPARGQHQQDYRDSRTYFDEQNKVEPFAQWTADQSWQTAGVKVPAGTPSADKVEDFLMVRQIQPSYMVQLADSLSGKSQPSPKYAVTASIAKIFRATDENDQVRAANVCRYFLPGNTPADAPLPSDYPKVLGFVPGSAYGWCYVLLSSFDTMLAIYKAVSGFFGGISSTLRDIKIPFFDVCIGCPIADLLDALVEEVIGPKPPETRTSHIELTAVGCIPFLHTAANLANKSFSLGDAVKLAEGDLQPDPGDQGGGQAGTCTG